MSAQGSFLGVFDPKNRDMKMTGIRMLIILGALSMLAWLNINYPETSSQSTAFWLLGLLSAIFIVFSFIISKKAGFQFDFITPLAGTGILKLRKRWIMVLFIGIFLFTFFGLARAGYSITAPKLQIVDLGLFGDIMLSIPGAIIENVFFFSALFGFVFTIMLLLTRSPTASLLIAAIIIGPTFVLYHFLVYGFTNIPASLSVLLFGWENIMWMIVFADLFITDARHIANNLALIVFSQMSLQTFFMVLLLSPYFWVIMIFLILVIWIRLRSRGGVPVVN